MAAFDLSWVRLHLCVLTSSASTSPAEKPAKFETRATGDEEEAGRRRRRLSPANEDVSCTSDLYDSGKKKAAFSQRLVAFKVVGGESIQEKLCRRRRDAGRRRPPS